MAHAVRQFVGGKVEEDIDVFVWVVIFVVRVGVVRTMVAATNLTRINATIPRLRNRTLIEKVEYFFISGKQSSYTMATVPLVLPLDEPTRTKV